MSNQTSNHRYRFIDSTLVVSCLFATVADSGAGTVVAVAIIALTDVVFVDPPARASNSLDSL